jgi:hypothetical protein
MSKMQLFIYLLFAVSLTTSFLSSFIQGDWSAFFLIVVIVLLGLSPVFLKHRFSIEIGKTMQFGFVTFLFCTIFLGEIRNFYSSYAWWDTVLHFWAGFGLTIFGFAILKEIYRKTDLESYPFPTALYAFSFSGMMLGAWEIFEYTADLLAVAENKMQPSLEDTMVDLIIGYVAAAIFAILGYRYLRWRERNVASKVIEDVDLGAK